MHVVGNLRPSEVSAWKHKMIRESFKMRKLQWGPSERWCQPTRAHHDPFRHVHLDSGPYFRRSLPQSAAVTLALSLMLATLWLLLHRYGEQARHIIEKRLGLWVLLGAAVVVIGIVAALYLI